MYLEIARARGDVWKLEQKLAQARCDESRLTRKLYKLQAKEAEKRFDVAEARISMIHNSIHMTGGRLCDTAQKHRRTLSDDSIRIDSSTCRKKQHEVNETHCSLSRYTFRLAGGVTFVFVLVAACVIASLSCSICLVFV